MARTCLRLDDAEFWDTEPRRLFAMIDEWRDIDEYRMRVQAHLNRGGELPTKGKEKEARGWNEVHPDAF